MIYDYECLKCKQKFEIIKSYKHIDDVETCPNCKAVENRRIITGGSGFFGANDWDTAQYCPVLGKVIKSNAERRRIAKQMGYEEVGNENLDKIAETGESRRNKQIDENLEIAHTEASKYIRGY